VLALPIYTDMTAEECDGIVEASDSRGNCNENFDERYLTNGGGSGTSIQ
jgi:hypothetical protein